MGEIYTASEFADFLRKHIEIVHDGNQQAYADNIKVPRSFVNKVLKGKKNPSGKILKSFGAKRVVRFELI